ncbi:YciI family protein [Gryllotalpicola ginsengisoli]|uniref:YciI family protein n=1 Tax=Gryllotalpicola ginsengisoli TaxID=444608 RepID=UPI0003B55764|nr:YciI family protein [Gryllotalpicola ginsengisoli]
MAKYLVLIYDDEQQLAGADPSIIEANHERHVAFNRDNGAAVVGGAQLKGSETATSIRTRPDGTVTVTDGVFAETKEVLGGYYVIDAPDYDAALALAKQVPAVFGGVEVRPIIDPGA